MKKNIRFAAALAAFSVFGCLDDGKGGDGVDFDREAMLVNLADRIIMPGYARLESEMRELEESIADLIESPDSAQAETARKALREAWIAWQGVSAYEVGPAAQVALRQRLNTFPVKPTRVDANIAAGTWNLETVSNYDAKGFPALDYLLHGRGGSIDTLLAGLKDSAAGEARCRYLSDVAAEMAGHAARVREAWDADGGNFRKTFVTRLGTDIGSSLGELVNQFNFDYELLKNARIGIPLGKKTLEVPLPEKVEAFYSGYSLTLAKAHLDALENLFRGRDPQGADGPGMDDYLDALGTRYQDGDLSESIKNRFAAARNALEAISDPLSESILEEKDLVDKAYSEIQRMVVLTKTDMPSAFSVSITYQDSDGD